ncbi:nose resistant to fluoxetine protein 6-like [Anabrus simplex]|uniref:nose resistant to fluoxetine protein 6-like n=1 Tax=Anabrus simplex TaxID=316456 RepID=UPI0035A3C78D
MFHRTCLMSKTSSNCRYPRDMNSLSPSLLQHIAFTHTFPLRISGSVSGSASQDREMNPVPAGRMELRKDTVHWAVCIPAACTAQDLKRTLDVLLNDYRGLTVTVEEDSCQTAEDMDQVPRYPLFWMMVLAYLLVISLCTVMDIYITQPEEKNYAMPLWRAVSLRSGWRRLTAPTLNMPEHVSCLPGMRVFTLCLVVAGHRGEAMTSGPFIHGAEVEQELQVLMEKLMSVNREYGLEINRRKTKAYQDVVGATMMNGHPVVDTFFVISGFLLCSHLLRALKAGRSLSIPRIYLARYLRLTPAYAVVIAMHAFALYGLSSGPLWKDKVGRERDNCQNNWWTNLLYINNYIHTDRPCIDPSWYLACDTQLFMLTPLVALLLVKSRRVAAWVLGSLLAVSVAIPALITYIQGLDPTIIPDPETLGHSMEDPTYLATYLPAYCRAGPYIVGMVLAYWLYSMKGNKPTLPKRKFLIFSREDITVLQMLEDLNKCFHYTGCNNKHILYLGWPLMLFVQFAVTACGYFFYQYSGSITPLMSATYAGLHRPLFSVGIAFIMMVCTTGNGGFVNKILSYPPLVPLSRLSYCIFLVHPMVQMLHFGGLRAPADIAYVSLVWLSIGDLVLSTACALILYLTIEQPLEELGRILLPKNNSKSEH